MWNINIGIALCHSVLYLRAGLSWWIENNSNVPCFRACGINGQKLVVVLQKKMTISILSDMDRPHPKKEYS